MSTECSYSDCHETASETTTVSGEMRHVCSEHAQPIDDDDDKCCTDCGKVLTGCEMTICMNCWMQRND